jgi:hypothetical protein
MESINYLAVFVAAIAVFGLGSLWYTPILFGNVWLKEVGLTPEKVESGDMAKTFGIGFLCIFLMCLTLAMFLRGSEYTWLEGARWGSYAGFGLMGATVALNATYESKSWTYIAINAGYVTIGMAIAGAILRAWV